MRHLGFTGTRHQLPKFQAERLKFFLESYWLDGFRHFHHGDCVGADALSHEFAEEIGFKIWIHPPTDDKLRAYMKTDSQRLMLPKPYHTRNRDIVNASEAMIACPQQRKEIVRSGTWSTVRYARSVGKEPDIIWP